jgi:hypothetical protein
VCVCAGILFLHLEQSGDPSCSCCSDPSCSCVLKSPGLILTEKKRNSSRLLLVGCVTVLLIELDWDVCLISHLVI